MAAIRHALLAEQFAPVYRDLAAVQHTDTKGWSSEQRTDFLPRQLEANRLMPIYRASLFPEDDGE